tara:strand:+ start:175 stop:504 length:330 start_codon:yes stop_codon:yes gene_type:complete
MTEKLDIEKVRGTVSESWLMGKSVRGDKGGTGPPPKKKLYPMLMRALYEDGFFKDWRTPSEIAWEANKRVCKSWNQIKPSAVDRYIKKAGLNLRKRKQNMAKPWEYKLP